MEYMLLLYADESGFAKLSPDEMKAALKSFASYNRELAEAGVLKHGNPLEDAAAAKTLSRAGGALKTTDGPFAESKEQMGGYYVLEVESEEAAIHWASKCPILYGGKVEVRKLRPQL